jgi:hypothetical protein
LNHPSQSDRSGSAHPTGGRREPRRAVRAWAAAILAATIGACLLLAPAASAAPRSFYGVTAAGTPSAAEWSRLGAGGVGSVRMNFQWSLVQSGPDAPYVWNYYDFVVAGAALNGIEVLPTIYSSPTWAAASPEHPPVANYDRFQAFVRGAAARYGRNGSFWAENPGIPKIPITHWQIWNEPNSDSFWKPRPDVKGYMQMLRVARAGIKSADRRARIVLAGFFPTPNVRHGIWLKRYLKQIYRSKGGRKLFDVLTIHPYSLRPRHIISTLTQVRRIMAKFRDKKKPVWVTEIGWASQGQPGPLTVGLEGQASFLQQTFQITGSKKTRKKLKLQRVYWYSLRDTDNPVWYANTGLFRVDGSAKPSWNALVSLTGGTP